MWDLAVFAHPGRLSFTGIAQQWLRQAAKRWAAEELPQHRGKGATNVRAKINALARLSESLRSDPTTETIRPRWGGPDIENFLHRLGYLEEAGTISRYHRHVICRGARVVLAGKTGTPNSSPIAWHVRFRDRNWPCHRYAHAAAIRGPYWTGAVTPCGAVPAVTLLHGQSRASI